MKLLSMQKRLAAALTAIVCLSILIEPMLLAVNYVVFQSEVTAVQMTWAEIRVDYTYRSYPLLTGFSVLEVPTWRVFLWGIAFLALIGVTIISVIPRLWKISQ